MYSLLEIKIDQCTKKGTSNTPLMKRKDENKKEKDLWIEKEKYIQSELDMIHAYLVHHDWQNDLRNKSNTENKEKFVTKISNDIDISHQYKFGVDHDYIYLKPNCKSLRHELKNDKTINGDIFDELLIKAVKKKKYIDYLRCTHYDNGYKIIRNEKISIRHILSICLYTGMSYICIFINNNISFHIYRL